MSNKEEVTYDFDAFWEEQGQEEKTIRVLGTVYSLPPSPRASVLLKLLRMRKEKGKEGNIPEAELLEMSEELLGPEQMKKMLSDGLTIAQLEDVMRKIWEFYKPPEQNKTGKPGKNSRK